MSKKTFCVYILNCANNTFYTGYTDNLRRRYFAHLNGTSRCKYTRSFKPLSIARGWQIIGDKSLAMSVERFLKQLTRQQKIAYIARPGKLINYFTVKPISKRTLNTISSLKSV